MADEAPHTVVLVAFESQNLDTTCYRGSAPLKDLTVVSQADVFDQDANPGGLQRELSRKHALDAYDYAAGAPEDHAYPRAFPEIILNVRDKAVVQVERDDGNAVLTFDLDKILKARSVKVSRVDGNHRLMFGAGDGKGRPPIEAAVPFQLHVGLTPDQEASMFTDVNANQKGLNTSHLTWLRHRLTAEELELELHRDRVFASRLAVDELSPWRGLVHMGGSKAGASEAGVRRPVTFVALANGVKRVLRKSEYLSVTVTGDTAQYELIRRYWQAVRQLWPEAWESPSDYLVLKNLGVNTFSELGAKVIDRCLMTGDVELEDMVALLEGTKDRVDWHKDSRDVAGMSGNRAVLKLTQDMYRGLPKPQRGRKEAAAA